MGVAHRIGRVAADQVLRADVQPAGEADAVVHHQDLLVRAQVQPGHVPGQRRVHEARRRHPRPAQPAIGRREEIAAADAVDHTRTSTPRRCARTSASMKGAPAARRGRCSSTGRCGGRGLDGGEHARIGLVAVAQQPDRIARRRGAPRQPLAAAVERREQAVLRRSRARGDGRIPPGLRPAQRDGAAADAVDAEQGVDRATQEGRQPGEADPADRAADIALAQQGMRGHQRREHDVQGGEGDRGQRHGRIIHARTRFRKARRSGAGPPPQPEEPQASRPPAPRRRSTAPRAIPPQPAATPETACSTAAPPKKAMLLADSARPVCSGRHRGADLGEDQDLEGDHQAEGDHDRGVEGRRQHRQAERRGQPAARPARHQQEDQAGDARDGCRPAAPPAGRPSAAPRRPAPGRRPAPSPPAAARCRPARGSAPWPPSARARPTARARPAPRRSWRRR